MNKILFWFFSVTIQFFIFLVLYVVLRNLNPEGIIFYQGINLLGFLSGLYFLFYFLIKRNLDYALSRVPIILTSALLAYAFLMTLPVVLDRSITLHFLSYLSTNSPASIPNIQKDFIENFVVNSKAVEKRVDEQLVIGNIYIDDDQVFISKRGLFMHQIFDLLVKVFKINPTYKN